MEITVRAPPPGEGPYGCELVLSSSCPLQVYKQKLKHVLLEQQSGNTGLQTDAALTRLLVQKRNADTELRLQNDAHNLQADYREKKLHNENLLKELKLVSLDL